MVDEKALKPKPKPRKRAPGQAKEQIEEEKVADTADAADQVPVLQPNKEKFDYICVLDFEA